MLLCIIPTIPDAGSMIGSDPNKVPVHKTALLAASFMAGMFDAALMLLLA